MSFKNFYNPPLLNKVNHVQTNDLVINQNLTIITGANSGGKTQLLKAIGNNQILAQLGAKTTGKVTTTPTNRLCLRFGSSDDLQSNLSTFMYEMVQLAQVLSLAGPGSMILIDELGRGTGAEDGIGLSVATAEDIVTKNGVGIIVTHLHEVVGIVQNNETLSANSKIYHMDSQIVDNELVLHYQLQEGPDTSHGIQIAKACGIDSEVIAAAEAWDAVAAQFEPAQRNIAKINQTETTVHQQDSQQSLGSTFWEDLLVKYQMGLITRQQLKQLASQAE